MFAHCRSLFSSCTVDVSLTVYRAFRPVTLSILLCLSWRREWRKQNGHDYGVNITAAASFSGWLDTTGSLPTCEPAPRPRTRSEIRQAKAEKTTARQRKRRLAFLSCELAPAEQAFASSLSPTHGNWLHIYYRLCTRHEKAESRNPRCPVVHSVP